MSIWLYTVVVGTFGVYLWHKGEEANDLGLKTFAVIVWGKCALLLACLTLM